MGLWTLEQLRAFIKENKLVTAQDAQNALKDLFAETIQEMLEAEMDTHLGYEKHETKAKVTPNSRNRGQPRSRCRSCQAWPGRARRAPAEQPPRTARPK